MKSGSAICRGAEPGDGTTIKVYLPRCFGEERVQEQAKEPDTVKSTNWR